MKWEPLNRGAKKIPSLLARLIRQRGIFHDDPPFTISNDEDPNLEWLEGLRDARIEGASELVDAIGAHNIIEVGEDDEEDDDD